MRPPAYVALQAPPPPAVHLPATTRPPLSVPTPLVLVSAGTLERERGEYRGRRRRGRGDSSANLRFKPGTRQRESCSRSGAAAGRHLRRRMFHWNDQEQQQQQVAGDKIRAQLDENEVDPTAPSDMNDSGLACVGDQKQRNDDGEAATVPGLTERTTSDASTEHPALEKLPAAAETSGYHSATRLDVEFWPDLPSLTTTLDGNDTITSTYLDFSSAPSLQKVTGIASVQLNGEPQVFGSEHEEENNSFLDCDWGNIGDFDDFNRLFSNSDALFGNEMIVNANDFLSTSSAVLDSTVQSAPSLGDVQKRPIKSPGKPKERSKSKTSNTTSGFSHGQHPSESLHSLSSAPAHHLQTLQYTLLHDNKYMEQLRHVNQLTFPGYGYPANPFPTIPLVSNIQAEGHQAHPMAASCVTSVDSSKQSSLTEKPVDIPSKPLMMTPQEKIEKLRRRQQRQALIAIQQQQQEFGQEGSGSSTLLGQAYFAPQKNPDSSSSIIDENAPQQTSTGHEEILRKSRISDDSFIEEKIYHELKKALGKLVTSSRLCIRDSLFRLAHSSSERQIAGNGTRSNKSKRGEAEVSEKGKSNRRKRYPSKEAETDTNPVDRIVANLLFHRPCSNAATSALEETLSLTLTSLKADPKMPRDTNRVPSEDQQNAAFSVM